MKIVSGGRIALVALMPMLLTACGGANVLPAPTPTPSPTPASISIPTSPPPASPAAAYDESIGLGVDSNGFANLPLRSGARRIWVNSRAGSDSNDGLTPSAPKATIAGGLALITGGAGDQLMIAEGSTYARGPGDLSAKFGHSPQHPTVIQSYDPDDDANEAKYGRAGAGERPVLNTSADPSSGHLASSGSYYAMRGIDWNPGNLPDQVVHWDTSNYVLMENNVLRHTMVLSNGPNSRHHILRGNTIYGTWNAGGKAQGVSSTGITGLTIEDNIFWHNGWRVGGSRDAARENGGAAVSNHSIDVAGDTIVLARRNLFIDPSATGAMVRGDATLSENVFIDNPVAVSTRGEDYSRTRPNGSTLRLTSNLVLGDADIHSSQPGGAAFMTANGTPGSYIRGNLVLHSRTGAAYPFLNSADYNQPSHMSYENNLVYRYGAAIGVPDSPFPAQLFSIFEQNVWDAPTLGTNLNNSGVTFPNPVGAAEIYAHLGCNQKAACIAAMIESPERKWADRIRRFVFQAYGRT